MARIAKGDVNAALLRVAQHINKASGDDKITSRADMKAKLETLEGTEKQLADIFFRFMDHRDYKSGARITEKVLRRHWRTPKTAWWTNTTSTIMVCLKVKSTKCPARVSSRCSLPKN